MNDFLTFKFLCFFILGRQFLVCMYIYTYNIGIVGMNQTGMFVTVCAVILKITTLLLDGVYLYFMYII